MNCSAYDVLLDYLGNCLPLTGYFPNHKHLKINNTYYRVVGNLGEGAFSTVYLCEDTDGNRVAVKKMLCYRGTDTLAMARREISAYRTFSGIPGIIRLVDWSVEDNIMEDRSEVFMCFPVLKNGTLADNMGERRSEMWVVRVFLKLCRSVDRMHKFEGPLLPLDDSDSNRETRRPGMTSHRYVPVASRGEEE
ncbi:Serine/threonine-protein kinase env7, partial [Coemansia asiatica]